MSKTPIGRPPNAIVNAMFLAYAFAIGLVLVPMYLSKGTVDLSFFDGMLTASGIMFGFLAVLIFASGENTRMNYALHFAIPYMSLNLTIITAFMLSLGFNGQDYVKLPVSLATITFLTSSFSLVVFLIRRILREELHVPV